MPVLRSISAALAALALAATLGLAACGSDSETTTSESQGATTTESQGAPLGARADVCKSDESADGEVRVTGAPCALGRSVVKGWHRSDACAAPADASRPACRLGGFICLGVRTGQGLAVTCAARGRSVAFLAKPR
jgi:hypothetical protein